MSSESLKVNSSLLHNVHSCFPNNTEEETHVHWATGIKSTQAYISISQKLIEDT